MPRAIGWDREFHDPIELPRGRKLRTLREAAHYITSLPRRERGAEYWRPAATLLKLIGENDGCLLMARIAVMHGLRKGVKDIPAPEPRRKRARAYKIIRAK